MGFDGLFIGRLDYQDKLSRLTNKSAEMIWKSSSNLGEFLGNVARRIVKFDTKVNLWSLEKKIYGKCVQIAYFVEFGK